FHHAPHKPHHPCHNRVPLIHFNLFSSTLPFKYLHFFLCIRFLISTPHLTFLVFTGLSFSSPLLSYPLFSSPLLCSPLLSFPLLPSPLLSSPSSLLLPSPLCWRLQ